jgi:hypothetical protein
VIVLEKAGAAFAAINAVKNKTLAIDPNTIVFISRLHGQEFRRIKVIQPSFYVLKAERSSHPGDKEFSRQNIYQLHSST